MIHEGKGLLSSKLQYLQKLRSIYPELSIDKKLISILLVIVKF